MILLTILNTFLPSVAVAAVTWIALHLFRVNAATRFLAWWAVLASLIAMLASPEHDPLPVITTSIATTAPAPVTIEPRVDWLSGVTLAWGLYACYRLIRIGVSYVHLRALVRRAIPTEAPIPASRRPVRLLASHETVSPMAVGYWQPVILLPEGLRASLTKSEYEHVLLHELAHIARYDDWTKLLSRLINAVLGLHPVAAFVLHQIEKERELACDDWVVASTGDARGYAASLTHVFEISRG